MVESLALLYTVVGEHDAAIDQLEYLLTIPSIISVPRLKFQPVWESFHKHPRFKRLLEKHAENESLRIQNLWDGRNVRGDSGAFGTGLGVSLKFECPCLDYPIELYLQYMSVIRLGTFVSGMSVLPYFVSVCTKTFKLKLT